MKLLALIDIPDNDYVKQDAYWYLTGDNLQLKYIDKNKATKDLSNDLECYKQISDVIELEELLESYEEERDTLVNEDEKSKNDVSPIDDLLDWLWEEQYN